MKKIRNSLCGLCIKVRPAKLEQLLSSQFQIDPSSVLNGSKRFQSF